MIILNVWLCETWVVLALRRHSFLLTVAMKGIDVSIDHTLLFGVHMDNEKSQHTLWIKMAGVHWAHYFSLLTLICWLKKTNVYFSYFL